MARLGQAQEALDQASLIADAQKRGDAYVTIASVLAEAGRPRDAEAAFVSAQEVMRSIADDVARTRALRGLAKAQARVEAAEAARLAADGAPPTPAPVWAGDLAAARRARRRLDR